MAFASALAVELMDMPAAGVCCRNLSGEAFDLLTVLKLLPKCRLTD